MSQSICTSIRILALTTAALFGIAGVVCAQGFQILNGRNHPELEWQVAETEHFRIVYPSRIAGIEFEAAAVAEESYDALASNFQTTFDRKIDIFLSNEDEIANGFAVPLGTGHTNIWVHVSEYADLKTGREKWLRSVIAHELAHIFHYQTVLIRPRWLNFLLADPLPRFWTEGIAQYQTERWTTLRGERWLRTAVLDDRLSYADSRSLNNGRLLYAVGNAQVRYLADRYGDSTLVRILHHRKNALFGLVKVHDFHTAFRTVRGQSYQDFYDEWRRHVNIFYNTMAGQMERPDSLDVDPLRLPGQFYFDAAFSPDTSHLAVLALTSLERPVRRLYVVDRETDVTRIVAEGTIYRPVSWSPDGTRLAYARLRRVRHGSLLRDLYIVDRDGSNAHRVTNSRRAGSPAFSPDGGRLAFSATENGTDNLFVLDLASGREEQLTDYNGDVQLSSLRWHPRTGELVFDRFLEDGRRDIVALDVGRGITRAVTDGTHDDRDPVWSPDGSAIAYTSLRDRVPNVFVADSQSGTHRRVTALVGGAEVMDWLPPDSAGVASLLVASQVTRSGDRAYRIDAARTVLEPRLRIAPPYAAWTSHEPPETVPPTPTADEGLITSRYPYRAHRNLVHVASAVIPYVWFGGDYGLAGFTSWTEALGKHSLAVGGALSMRDPRRNSYGAATYVNNQLRPTIGLSLYRLPGTARLYGRDLLVETFTGGDVTLRRPLDRSDHPYVSEEITARVRLVDVEPLTREISDPPDELAPPGAGGQADVQLGWTWKKHRPYRRNTIHPIDGIGLRLRLTGALGIGGADHEFLRSDVSGFGVFAGPGLHRLYVYGRFQVQEGESFPQDFVGLSRHDDVRVNVPFPLPISLGESERVRGYGSYALGNRLLFGSVEYRVPLIASLQTRVLGALSLGGVAAAAFADGAFVWTGAGIGDGESRLGLGIELKNALQLGGVLRIAHAVGVAQPAVAFGSRSDYEIYYRIRTPLAF